MTESMGQTSAGAARPQPLQAGELSSVRRVVAVISGKGGVGKSTVTALLAVLARRAGLRTGILDADITGPSIPRAFGIRERAEKGPDGIFPVRTKTGIEVMSVGLLLETETAPVIWRGAVLADMVTQFYSNVVWDDLDILFVDCPPGTGDVPLTVLGRLPVDCAVAVTSPQELVSMIVEKSIDMTQMLSVPLAGIVENFSSYLCPKCHKVHPLFGESHIAQIAAAHGIETVAKLPQTIKLTAAADRGTVELFEGDWLDALAEKLFADLL